MKNDDLIVIPGTGIHQKDCREIRTVINGSKTLYYVTVVNRGGRCRECGQYCEKVKEYKKKKIPLSKNAEIIYKARRFVCMNCQSTFYEENPFRSRDGYLSDVAVKYILNEIKRYNHTFSEIAASLDISVTKVIDIFDGYVQIKRKSLREVISIDEFYFSRHSRKKYAFLILGLNGEILDVLDSRRKNVLLDYFKYIPIDERSRVKYVTMDMHSPYRDAIKRRLPNATIVVDSFHVVKLISDHLNRIRKRVMARFSDDKRSDAYYLLKSRDYLLFMKLEDVSADRSYNSHYRLEMSDSEMLDDILKIDDKLTKAYWLKEDYLAFNSSFGLKRKEIEDRFDEYIKECEASDVDQFINLSSTLNKWREEILNSFISYKGQRLSNGKIENKNKYIKKIKDIANGYANFKRFRNRIMYSENMYDKPLEERSKNRIARKMPPRKNKPE